MTKQDRMMQWMHSEDGMECCSECRHYVEHYVRKPEKKIFIECGSGHCVKERCRMRRAWDTCEGFERKESPGKSGQAGQT